MTFDIDSWVKSPSKKWRAEQKKAIEIVIKAIALGKNLCADMVMKGGMLLILRYNHPRYSGDIDFSTPATIDKFDQVFFKSELNDALYESSVRCDHGIICQVQSFKLKPKLSQNPTFPTLRINIGYAHKSNKTELKRLRMGASINVVKIDYSFNEPIYNKDIIKLSDGSELTVYSLSEIIAEKFRAILQQPSRQRARRQDIFDIYTLLTNSVVRIDDMCRKDILNILRKKCSSRGIEVDSKSMSFPAVKEWAKKQYHQISQEIEGSLESFEDTFFVVETFYSKLPWSE